MRDSVYRALSTDADVTVVGVAEDYDSTVELVEKHQPTMLLTDVRMPPTSTDEGIRLARWMRTAHPDTGVIVLSQYADPQLRGGVAGRRYGGPRVSVEGTCFTFRPAQRGGAPSRRPVGRCSIRWWWRRCWPSRAPPRLLSRLTPREREVLAELATGLSNRSVAQRLVLSQRAVEKHINSIFAKLGLTIDDSVDRRVKAVLMFLDDVTFGLTKCGVYTMVYGKSAPHHVKNGGRAGAGLGRRRPGQFPAGYGRHPGCHGGIRHGRRMRDR